MTSEHHLRSVQLFYCCSSFFRLFKLYNAPALQTTTSSLESIAARQAVGLCTWFMSRHQEQDEAVLHGTAFVGMACNVVAMCAVLDMQQA